MMTQPPSPGDMAKVDQFYAIASQFLDQILISTGMDVVGGMPVERIYTRVGASLMKHSDRHELELVHLHTLVVIAVTRLARMRHAVEQLADVQDELAGKYSTPHESDVGNGMANAYQQSAMQLRKLVADHG